MGECLRILSNFTSGLNKRCGRLWHVVRVTKTTRTSLSAALFSLPETTNSGEKKGYEEGKSECSPGAPFTSCADEKIGEKGRLCS